VATLVAFVDVHSLLDGEARPFKMSMVIYRFRLHATPQHSYPSMPLADTIDAVDHRPDRRSLQEIMKREAFK
jgi:hypothetical protein